MVVNAPVDPVETMALPCHPLNYKGCSTSVVQIPMLNMSFCFRNQGVVAQSVGGWVGKQSLGGVLVTGDVPGHLQGTANVPLSKVLNPQMFTNGPAANSFSSGPHLRPYAAVIERK